MGPSKIKLWKAKKKVSAIKLWKAKIKVSNITATLYPFHCLTSSALYVYSIYYRLSAKRSAFVQRTHMNKQVSPDRNT